MILACQTVETFGRHTLYRYVTSFQNFKQFTRQVSLQFTFYQYFINLLIGLDCLDHGTDAEHHFVFFHSSISFPFYRRAIRLFPALCGQRYKDLEIKLIGDHQVNNSVLALSAIEILNQLKHLNINKDDIRRGLINTRWPGRIEKILNRPTFIIDGAHNEDGARSLAKAIEKNFKGKKATLLIGMLEDKDIDAVLEILMPYFDKVITTTPDNDRAMNCEILKEKISKYVDNVISKENIEEAVNYTLKNAKEDDIIISAGSLYMIGTVRTLLNDMIMLSY